MGLLLVEVRESNAINNGQIASAIHEQSFATKEDLIKGLEEAGLPESQLYLIRVYTLEDLVDILNSGETFDALASIQSDFEPPVTNRIVEF